MTIALDQNTKLLIKRQPLSKRTLLAGTIRETLLRGHHSWFADDTIYQAIVDCLLGRHEEVSICIQQAPLQTQAVQNAV